MNRRFLKGAKGGLRGGPTTGISEHQGSKRLRAFTEMKEDSYKKQRNKHSAGRGGFERQNNGKREKLSMVIPSVDDAAEIGAQMLGDCIAIFRKLMIAVENGVNACKEWGEESPVFL